MHKFHLPRAAGLMLLFAVFPLLGGCAAAAVAVVSKAADIAIEASGLKKPAIPELQKPPRNVQIKMYAGANLNAGDTRQAVALVTRIYKLRDVNAFRQAAYEAFLNPAREKETLGADLIDVREVLLIPGQRYEVTEKVGREASFIGVVALFATPARERWKVAFGAEEAERTGITIGAHACALTVTVGSALASTSSPASSTAAGSDARSAAAEKAAARMLSQVHCS